ncbi:MAG: DUF6506 family protein [Methyloligellaceae bacterium]
MALSKFGFIVTGAGMNSEEHRMVMASDTLETIVVGVSKPEDSLPVARELVDSGVQLIELCGGFGPVWTAKVIDAISGKVPVGSVGYGPESIDGMYELFK